jgi:hypothetical protein
MSSLVDSSRVLTLVIYLVNTQGKPSDVVNDGKIYDELVVFQEAQVIPKYVIHIK